MKKSYVTDIYLMAIFCVKVCRQYHIAEIIILLLLTLPPHTCHRMQRLNVIFFGPFSYKRDELTRKNEMDTSDVVVITCKLFKLVAIIDKRMIHVFRKCGIYLMH